MLRDIELVPDEKQLRFLNYLSPLYPEAIADQLRELGTECDPRRLPRVIFKDDDITWRSLVYKTGEGVPYVAIREEGEPKKLVFHPRALAQYAAGQYDQLFGDMGEARIAIGEKHGWGLGETKEFLIEHAAARLTIDFSLLDMPADVRSVVVGYTSQVVQRVYDKVVSLESRRNCF